jgi:hypothetical protein
LFGYASYLYYSNSGTEVLPLALELGSVTDIAKVGAAGTRASTEDLGCDKLEDADSSSEAKAHDAEAADETYEESDSTDDSLEEDSADHNLPVVALATAAMHQIEATNLASYNLDLYFVRQDFVADLLLFFKHASFILLKRVIRGLPIGPIRTDRRPI